MEYITVPLEKAYIKKDFDCGKASLNDYIKRQASQDIKKMLSVCFVMLEEDEKTVYGYYTLSNGSIPYNNVPEQLRKRYPKSYDYIPVTYNDQVSIVPQDLSYLRSTLLQE